MRPLWMILFLLLAGNPLMAGPEDTFRDANGSFLTGKHAEAIQGYESLISSGHATPAVHFNLANACFRDGQVGLAVLHYEKSLWLNPRDADVRGNLKFIRKQAGLFETETPWWKWHANGFSLNQWCWMLGILWILFCTLQTIRLLVPLRNYGFPWLAGVLILGIILAASATVSRLDDRNCAVVLNPDTPLKIAPMEQSPASFSLPAGAVVKILKTRDQHAYIEFEGGRNGWMLEEKISRIAP